MLDDDKNDSRAFIFKLKDKNTIEPTKYKINKKGKHAIKCNEKCGVHCHNRITCYLLAELIISVSKHY